MSEWATLPHWMVRAAQKLRLQQNIIWVRHANPLNHAQFTNSVLRKECNHLCATLQLGKFWI
jgi:hypothetical protein